MNKKIYTVLFMFLVASQCYGSSEFEFQDVIYNPISSTEAEAVGLSESPGLHVDIFSTVVNGNKTYTVKTIADGAFKNCTYPADFAIGDGITTIGNNAFEGCDAMTKIDIPSSVTTIGNNAFQDCGGLDKFTEDLDGVETIGDEAFLNCANLTSFTIPSSVKSIGSNAFKGCNLTEVYLPLGSTPATLGTTAFGDNVNFYILDGTGTDASINTYKTAASWSSYAKKIFPYLPKTMTAAKVATLYLPYEVAIPEDVTAYYCCGKSNTALGMKQLGNKVIPANTPVYLTSTDASTYNFLGNGGTSVQSGVNTALKGTSTDKTVTAKSCYTLGKRNESPNDYGFFLYTGTKIAAHTCYVDYGSGNGAKGFGLSFDDESTAINDITNSSSAADANAPKVIYDLQGRRVNTPQRGSLYIVNGKKVLF